MRICFIPTDTSGVGRYRLLSQMRELNKLGVDGFTPEFRLFDHPVTGKEFVQFSMTVHPDAPLDPDADIYVFQRRMDKGSSELFTDLRARGRIVVCETDDLYPVPTYNAAYADSSPKANDELNWTHMHKGFRVADYMTVSTDFLAECYSSYCPRITVLPNYLDWEMWRDVPLQNEVDRGGRVRVGWMGLAWFRSGDLDILRGLLPQFLERNPHVDFVAVHDDKHDAEGKGVHDVLGIPADRRVTLPKARFSDLRLLMHMDVGLVPLAQNRFNEAKSALKGMEYNANGIPFIASPTAEYRKWTVEGENGFLSRRPQDWLRHLELLCNDHDLRRDMGVKARLKASRWTIQEHAHEWLDYYRSLEPVPLVDAPKPRKKGIPLTLTSKPREHQPLAGGIHLRPQGGARKDLLEQNARKHHRKVAHRPVLLAGSMKDVDKDPVVQALRRSQVSTELELKRATGR